MNQDASELISRYVYHVGKHLPPERREDVARELRSLIGDRVDDELRPDESRETVVLRVLREMGPPQEVAARYGYERRLLIGPSSLAAFSRLVMVLPVVVLAFSLLTFPWNGLSSSAFLAKWLLGCLTSVLLNLGVLVVVFIVLERLSSFRAKPEAAFDPARLSPAPAPFDGGKLRPVGIVVEIYVAVGLLVLFNFYPNVIGVWTNSGSARFWAVPLSALGVHVPLWLLNMWLAGSILLKTEVLRQGSWTRDTRWIQIGLSVLGLVVFIAAMSSSHFGQLDAKFLAAAGLSASDPRIAALARAAQALALAAAPLALLILFGIAKDVWRLSRSAGSPA